VAVSRSVANLRDLCRLLPLRPPCLHHRRQLLSHSRTHWLPTSGFLGDRRSLLRPRFAFLPCPPSLLCSADSGTCGCAHTATFLADRLFSLTRLGWTASACGLGTESHKSCNCLFDTVSFLSELCHYALNVHVVLSLIVMARFSRSNGQYYHSGFGSHGGWPLNMVGRFLPSRL
jgi:hypothetical protein